MNNYIELDRPNRFTRFEDFAESLASYHVPTIYWTNGFFFHPRSRESLMKNGKKRKPEPVQVVGATYFRGEYHRYIGVDSNDRAVKVADDFKEAGFQPTDWVVTALKFNQEDLGELEFLAYKAILKRERELSRRNKRQKHG